MFCYEFIGEATSACRILAVAACMPLGVYAQSWATSVAAPGSLFRRIAGEVEQLLDYAQRRGQGGVFSGQVFFSARVGRTRAYAPRYALNGGGVKTLFWYLKPILKPQA
jgi:hypothetical protein